MLLPLSPTAVGAAAGVQIVNPVYASGIYYSDQGITSSLQVRNSGAERDTFWVRYAVQDKAGGTYDVPATPITLDPGDHKQDLDGTQPREPLRVDDRFL